MTYLHRTMLMAVLLAGCTNGPDYGEGLCNAQLEQPDLCEATGACSNAILAASSMGGACYEEVQALAAGTPASYRTCFDACPAQRTCMIAGSTVDFTSCSCQAQCVREAPAEFSDAVQAFADCLEAEAAVTAGCY